MTEQYLNVCALGNDLCVRGVDSDGIRFSEKIPYEPYVYVKSQDESKEHSISGHPMKRVDYPNIISMYKAKKAFKEQNIPMYGMDNVVCQYMNDTYTTKFNVDKIRVFYIDIENMMKGDDGINHGIDPESAHGMVTAITIYDTFEKKYHTFGLKVWENVLYKHLNIEYYHCEDEYELLKTFLKFWSENHPDIVTGWNSTGYDIPYLINRITNEMSLGYLKKLSPWGKLSGRSFRNLFGKTVVDHTIYGISSIDYMDIYKKNKFHKQESYKLDFIANLELGKGKIDYHADGYKDLDDLYERNPQAYIDYNIRDVESLIEIDNKNKFMDIVIGIAYYSLVNYDEVYSVLRCWDSIRHGYLQEYDIVTSPKSFNPKLGKFPGAYVKKPIAKLYRWVMTFDLEALYPNIMRTLNVGDETLVSAEDLPDGLLDLYGRDLVDDIIQGRITKLHQQLLIDNNLTMAANGMFYHNTEKSVQSILAENILAKRATYKLDMLKYKQELVDAKSSGASKEEIKRISDLVTYNKNMQMVVKVLANSLYGAMGNEYDRYFDVRLATSITLTGQTIIKWAEIKMNDYLNKILKTKRVSYCIYSDTDSIFLNLEELVNRMDVQGHDDIVDFLDKAGEKLNDKLSEAFTELGSILNTQNNMIKMKREVISESALFRSKKNYAMKVWDNEGVRYADPDYKIMGIETQKSTTPGFVKKHLKHVIERILSGCDENEILDYVDDIRDQYKSEKDFEKIFFPKGTNNLEKYADETTIFLSGCPLHVRGALMYNHYFAGDDDRIESGDNVRYTYLRLPNPIKSNVISVTDTFPTKMWKYIDWETNFEKIFEDPVKSLAKPAGWSLTNTVNMSDLL